MYDLIIKNGRIVDGTGKDAFLGDIVITDGKIADIGILDEKQALSSIDAKKHWVTPGFIDPHSHADMSLLVWHKMKLMPCKVLQHLSAGIAD